MTNTLTPVRARPLHEDPRIHGRRWFLLAMMCLSLVLVVMSVSGLVTAIPTMQEALNASASQIQWILDAYAIVFAGSLLTAGALGDRFGRKRALLTGLTVFGLGSVVAVRSDQLDLLVAYVDLEPAHRLTQRTRPQMLRARAVRGRLRGFHAVILSDVGRGRLASDRTVALPPANPCCDI